MQQPSSSENHSFTTVQTFLTQVNSGELALKFNIITGLSEKTYIEGYNFKIPFIERPIVYYTRTRTFNTVAMTPDRNLQQVTIKASVMFKPDPKFLHTIHRELGQDYDSKSLNNIVNEVIRGVVAQYNAQQLISQRDQISFRIKMGLTQRAKQFNVLIDDFAISDIRFTPQYQEAVEKKQIAMQTAEEAKFRVIGAEQMKKSEIIKAEADAQSITLIGEAVKSNPGIFSFKKKRIWSCNKLYSRGIFLRYLLKAKIVFCWIRVCLC